MTRKICFFVARAFGVRPRRIVSASVVASNFVWWTQNSDPAATVRPHAVPSRRSATQRR
jgi:hypothetical protein